MPIITNAHTHLELTGLAHICPSQPVDFINWIGKVAWRRRWRRISQIQADIALGIEELRACGTTNVGDITATWMSVEPLLASGLRGVVYLEVLGLRRDKALLRLKQAQTVIQQTRKRPDYGPMQIGLSLHAPYSCHPDLLRAGAAWCRSEGVPLCLHVAESPAETALLLHGDIPSVRPTVKLLAKLLGVWPSWVPGLRPIPYLASLGVLAARPLLVHAVQVTDADIQVIADADCAVVHCPRSNVNLSCGRMPLERYLAAGVRVYLGTDSRASSPSLNVWGEVRFAQKLHEGLVDAAGVEALIHQSLL